MVGIKSDAGNVRELNEDYASFIEDERFKIYLVADGMGGHNAGEIASNLAVKSIMRYLMEHSEENEDPYYYCFHDEGCHIIYHRFLPEDYEDFGF